MNPPPPTFLKRATGLRLFTGRNDEESTLRATADPIDAAPADMVGDPSHPAPRVLRVPPDIEQTDSLFAAARQVAGSAWHPLEADLLPLPLTPEVEPSRGEMRKTGPGNAVYAARISADSPIQSQASEAIGQPGLPSEGGMHELRCDPSLDRARILSHELDTWRQRRVIRVLNRLLDRYDLQNALPPAYRQLQDDSLLFQPDLRGFCLQASVSLQRVGGLEYPLVLPRRGLNGLLLAPVSDVRPTQGSMRMEIRLPTGELAARATFPVAELRRDVPVRLEFAPLEVRDRPCRLGVFADDVDVPLYVLEWRKYRYWGLGRTRSRAFCGLLFSGQA